MGEKRNMVHNWIYTAIRYQRASRNGILNLMHKGVCGSWKVVVLF